MNPWGLRVKTGRNQGMSVVWNVLCEKLGVGLTWGHKHFVVKL